MRIIKSFVAVWTVYWLLQIILPIRPVGDGIVQAMLLQLAFVLTVIAGYSLVAGLHPGRDISATWQVNDRVLAIALALSLVGTLALAYDKIIVQGIDYSSGLAFAREQWQRAGLERSGSVSSPLSVLGYLLSSCYMVVLALIAPRPWNTRKYVIVLCAAGLALVNTLLTGGRSTLILTLLFYASALSITPPSGRPKQTRALKNRATYLAATTIVLCTWYFLYIFEARAEATGISIRDYSREVLYGLGLRPTAFLDDLSPDNPLTGSITLLVTATAYFTHSFATTVSIIDFGPARNSATVIFVTGASIAAKLHLINPIDTEWFLAGAFPSLPGALYLQSDWCLTIFASLVFGMMTGLAHWWHRESPSILSFGVMAGLMCTLLASPILFAADVMMFPFAMAQFGLIYLISKKFGK